MWCGKKLCELCIARQEGRKFYCENCAVHLSPYKREKLPVPAPRQIAPLPVQPEAPAVKRRFVLGKDGYFELR
jgi:hypothetical protein